MVKLPLEKRLKKSVHRKTALAQDLLVEALYEHFPRAVIHGGTAIWRCYNGNRFSEDIDVYIPKKPGEEGYRGFLGSMESKGLAAKKFKTTANSIFSKFELAGAEVRFEAVFKSVRSVTKPFELVDGTFMNVYTLEPEELLREKMLAYRNRRKARDLYDIWFLLNVADASKIKVAMKDFAGNIEEPEDYGMLKALIIFGAVPSVKDLVEGVSLWARKNT